MIFYKNNIYFFILHQNHNSKLSPNVTSHVPIPFFLSLHGRIKLSSLDPNSPFSFHLKQNFQHNIVNFWFPGGRLFSITHLPAAYAHQSSWSTVRAQYVCQMNNANFLKAHEFISCCKISCLNVY